MHSLYDTLGTQTLHHAYIIRDHTPCGGELRTLIAKAYPEHEMVHVTTDVFGIEESRRVVAQVHVRAGRDRFFILEAHAITAEAQNALLKVLEEPPSKNHFFVCVPHECQVLATLRSRVHEIRRGDNHAESTRAEVFLALPHARRIAHLEPLLKEKDVVGARMLIADIERYAHAHGWMYREPEAIRHLFSVREAIAQSGAPLKVLIESIALTMPKE